MDSFLTNYDYPLLSSAGFDVGMSGTSWFGKDSTGQEWQVYQGPNEFLEFSTLTERGLRHKVGCMTREDFDRLFMKEKKNA